MMTVKPVYNFSAGPATIPAAVLARVQLELSDYRGTGMSVLTLSHRSEIFLEILQQAEADLRELLQVPASYAVLFLQGGASSQFSQIAWNLAFTGSKRVGSVISGHWSKTAALVLANIPGITNTVIADSNDKGCYRAAPAVSAWQRQSDLEFIHFTSNETVDGVEYLQLPRIRAAGAPFLVSDMSSDLLSRPLAVSDFGLIYAGAQKNIGPAGVTVVIIRRQLLDRCPAWVNPVFSYNAHVNKDGMYNTPATFSIYVCGLVLQWLKNSGGLTAMAAANAAKARLLYAAIDNSGGFYRNLVTPAFRSVMNVLFYTPEPALDRLFAAEASLRGLYFLRGHKQTGGIRASIYNAMPLAGVEALTAFMHDFHHKYGAKT